MGIIMDDLYKSLFQLVDELMTLSLNVEIHVALNAWYLFDPRELCQISSWTAQNPKQNL